MKEACCDYELSKLLMEKGFDGECEYVVWEGAGESYDNIHKAIPCPTHQMAMAWIRVKGYHIYSYYLRDWNFVIQKLDADWEYHKSGYNSYEEAIEAALKYALENLI